MKNLFQNIAIFLVLVLSLLMVFFIVQYNLIDDGDDIETFTYKSTAKQEGTTKEKRTNYLQNLEGYSDVDVQVDAHKESMTNTVIVKSELSQDAIDSAVEDRSKSSYMENLKDYSKIEKDEKLDEIKPVDDGVGAPQILEKEEVEDTIGMAIDALLDE